MAQTENPYEAQDRFQGALKEFSSTIGGIFMERLNQKQYEDFIEGPTKDLEAKLQQAQELMLDEENPDAASQGLHMVKGALDSYMTEGIRYKTNPYIMSKVQTVFQANNDFLLNQFELKFKQAQMAEAQEKATTEREMRPLKMETERSTAELNKAKAEKARAEATGEDSGTGEEGVPYLTGAPGSLEGLDPDSAVKKAYANVVTNVTRPQKEADRKTHEANINRIIETQAKEELARRAGLGETYTVNMPNPLGTGINQIEKPWDVNSEDDLKIVKSQIDPELAKQRYIVEQVAAEASVHGYTADDVSRNLAVVLDPTKASPTNPITRPLSEQEVGKVLLGDVGWRSLGVDIPADPATGTQRTKKAPLTIAEAASRLPDDFNKFQGPIKNAYASMIPVLHKKAEAGEFKTLKDVRDFLELVGQGQIFALLGGQLPNEEVTEGIRKNRETASVLAEAAADKYAPIIAARFGITDKKEEPAEQAVEEDKTSGVSKEWLLKNTPLGEMSENVGGIFRTGKAVGKGVLRKIQGE